MSHRLSTLWLFLFVAVPASADIVVDHQPHPYGGSASDTDFYYDIIEMSYWQLSADEVVLAAPAELDRITWWGYYRQDNPPSEEMIRFRLYEPENLLILARLSCSGAAVFTKNRRPPFSPIPIQALQPIPCSGAHSFASLTIGCGDDSSAHRRGVRSSAPPKNA